MSWTMRIDSQVHRFASFEDRAVVHAETSTGVQNDLAAIGSGMAALADALPLADCLTSLGGISVEVDHWNVDLAYAATQKSLGVAPGLSPSP
jgi:alanine-glyoxylate transaminase/serine-glyoxylate transaminase/serine-pyruvate transaminase